jgi:hypothetical protein
MSEFAPKVGKTATRGKKVIVEDNKSTLQFYQKWVLVSSVVHLLSLLFFAASSIWDVVFLVWFVGANLAAYHFMKYMAKATYVDGTLIDAGSDLNMASSLGDNMKDVIIVTSVSQILTAVISDYFILAWLLIPGRAFSLLWFNIIYPYLTSSSGQQPEPSIQDKKQKKYKTKMVNK